MMKFNKIALLISGLLGILGIGHFAPREYAKWVVKQEFAELVDKHREEYGTLKEPFFTVDGDFSAFSEENGMSASQISNFNIINSKLEDLEANFGVYEDRIRELELETNKVIETSGREGLESDLDLRNRRGKLELEALRKSSELGLLLTDLEVKPLIISMEDAFSGSSKRKRGPVIDNVSLVGVVEEGNNLFKNITCESLPDSLKVEFKDFDNPNTHGEHIWHRDLIHLRARDYLSTLIAYSHELGHAAYQGVESYYSNNIDLLSRKGFESVKTEVDDIKAFEEAAAYCFMVVACEELKKDHPERSEEIDEIVSGDLTDFLGVYRAGKREAHAEGWALAHSVAEKFGGDYVKAFNYLSTKNSFAQLRKDIIRDYDAERFRLSRSDSEIMETGLNIKERAESLKESYDYWQDNLK